MQKFRVFIGCVPGDAEESEILSILKSFAKVTSIKLARGRNPRNESYCLGYGFANCPTPEDAEILISMKQVIYRGRDLSLRLFKQGNTLKSEKKNFSNCRLFIGGVTSWVPFETLRPYFERHGTLEAFYQVDQSKSMKFKYGYAVYSNQESALSALNALNGFVYKGCSVRVEKFGTKAAATPEKTPKYQNQSAQSQGKATRKKKLALALTQEATRSPNNDHPANMARAQDTALRFNLPDSSALNPQHSRGACVNSPIYTQDLKSQDQGRADHITGTESESFTTGRGCFWVISTRRLNHTTSNIRMNTSAPRLLMVSHF